MFAQVREVVTAFNTRRLNPHAGTLALPMQVEAAGVESREK